MPTEIAAVDRCDVLFEASKQSTGVALLVTHRTEVSLSNQSHLFGDVVAGDVVCADALDVHDRTIGTAGTCQHVIRRAAHDIVNDRRQVGVLWQYRRINPRTDEIGDRRLGEKIRSNSDAYISHEEPPYLLLL